MTKNSHNVLLEFLITLPIFFMIIWTIVQILIYTSILNSVYNLAFESANKLSLIIENYNGEIKNYPDQKLLLDNLSSFSENVYILSEAECKNIPATKEKSICVFSKGDSVSVEVKTNYTPSGSFIKNTFLLEATAFAKGGTLKKEVENAKPGLFMFLFSIFILSCVGFGLYFTFNKKQKKLELIEPKIVIINTRDKQIDLKITSIKELIFSVDHIKGYFDFELSHKFETIQFDFDRFIHSYFELEEKEKSISRLEFLTKLELFEDALLSLLNLNQEKKKIEFEKLSKLFDIRYKK